MNYSFFLFSKLYDLYFPSEIPYDILHTEVCQSYEDFIASPYNVEDKSEHDCMINYLVFCSDIASI